MGNGFLMFKFNCDKRKNDGENRRALVRDRYCSYFERLEKELLAI